MVAGPHKSCGWFEILEEMAPLVKKGFISGSGLSGWAFYALEFWSEGARHQARKLFKAEIYLVFEKKEKVG